MTKKRNSLVIFCIVLVLFFLPFFWFKPGEVNLGGDSSRLYFYDPLNYLRYFAIYDITPTDLGSKNISYFMIPFTLLQLMIKSFIHSTSLQINLFHSFELITAFLSIYFIVSELLRTHTERNKLMVQFAGIIGGFFYIFNPIMGSSWDKALISQNQFFLNPLLFYFFLRFINTRKAVYIFAVLLITFIFSSNFAYASAPALFSFYPLAFFYLLLYATFVKKVFPSIQILLLGTVLFVGIQAFHLIPQIAVLIDRQTEAYQTVFSESGREQAGKYFIDVSANVKLTNNLLARFQTQMHTFVDYLVIIFPAILVLGLLSYNVIFQKIYRDKNYLLLLLMFLTSLFFDTANITTLAVRMYAKLFIIPGFEMFRNFYGQFVNVYYFFYALVFAYSSYYILIKLRGKLIFGFFALIIIFLTVNGWSFISGKSVNVPIYQTKNVSVPFKMNHDFEKVLSIFRELPRDGKVLTLPLTAYGYQVLGGVEGGAYKGPSMIGYLTGKKDFTGYGHAGPYADILLKLIQEKDYTSIQRLLAMLNIRYIFHNSDPYIYENFPIYPYDHMKKYFPTQQAIKKFVKNLPAKLVYKKNYYAIYEMNDSAYLPHIYIPISSVNINSPEYLEFVLSEFPINERYSININMGDSLYVNSLKIDTYSRVTKDYPLPVRYPFAKWKPESIVYPLILEKERRTINRSKHDANLAIDTQLLFAAKRISELSRWEGGFKVSRDIASIGDLRSYKQKKMFFLFDDFNTWEVSLSRYMRHVLNAIDLIDTENQSLAWKIEKKSKIYEAVIDHTGLLYLFIYNSEKSKIDKKYLHSLVEDIEGTLVERMKISFYDPSIIAYTVNQEHNSAGEYEVYMKRDKNYKGINYSTLKININNTDLRPITSKKDNDLIYFGKTKLSATETPFTISIPRKNIVSEPFLWENYSNVRIATSSAITILENFSQNSKEERVNEGFVKQIKGFRDKAHYILTFDYLTFGDVIEVSLLTKEKEIGKNLREESHTILMREKKSTLTWKKYTAVVESKSLDELLVVIGMTSKETKKIKVNIKNFFVTELPPHPDLVFKKVDIPRPPKEGFGIPKMSFVKINPTKYYVTIFGATGPYALVFLDKFDKDWKLYARPEHKQNIINISYFGGFIMEGNHSNAFINNDIFETWKEKTIADSSHFLANGYANGWNITPDDTGNRKNYTLVLEMVNQRIFLLSAVISLCSVLITMILFIANMVNKKSSLEKDENRFGGERLDSKNQLSKNNLSEHLSRYKMVKGSKNSTVLDIGCGSGHGSKVLAESFKKVYGIDVSEDAISYAKTFWQRKNITFLTGSGTDIPFMDNSFDITSAFEIIEHIQDWKKFLKEVRRVTKKNGKIYLSTPNKDIYNPYSRRPVNPHHFFEMRVPEFRKELDNFFTVQSFMGQRTPVYNDHWIWKIVDPFLYIFRNVISYKWNNALKLKIINWIKPVLEETDIVISGDPEHIRRSRTMLAICVNNKK